MGDTHPPGYNAYDEKGEGATPQVVYQPAQSTPVVIQTPAPQPTVFVQGQPQVIMSGQPVIVVAGPKVAQSFEPYTEWCQFCNAHVMTEVRFEWGSCTWIYCILGCILFCPLIFAICCDCAKDAHHSCPRCHRELAIAKR